MKDGLEALRALVPSGRPWLGERSWEWLSAELGTRLPGSLSDTLLEWLSGRLRVAGLYRFDKDELAEAATFSASG
ncbi:hypothetical protein ACFOWZ_00825 [Lentzea rhizosphaerae]|uniref:Uncharacterized protein n=1 Tax=Lentzea rhizosphaerae TaxID=2041025 RepID=A0ABV8BJG2_9PSEU